MPEVIRSYTIWVVFWFYIIICDNNNTPVIIETYFDGYPLCPEVVPYAQEFYPFCLTMRIAANNAWVRGCLEQTCSWFFIWCQFCVIRSLLLMLELMALEWFLFAHPPTNCSELAKIPVQPSALSKRYHFHHFRQNTAIFPLCCTYRMNC